MNEKLDGPIYLTPFQAEKARNAILCLVNVALERGNLSVLNTISFWLKYYAVLPEEGLLDFPEGDVSLSIIPE